MIPRPDQPKAPTREDLVQPVSQMLWKLFRGSGSKTANEVRDVAEGMKKEGATAREIFDETAKSASPDETGLFQNPASQWTFELRDNDARLTPEAMEWMTDRMSGGYGGDTDLLPLDRLLKHDLLYDYDPGMRKVKTHLEQPYDDAMGDDPGGAYFDPTTDKGKGEGRIEVSGKIGLPPDSLQSGSVLNTLGHEIQHPLQYRQGMPRGGNPRNPYMNSFFSKEMQPYIQKIWKQAAEEQGRYVDDYLNLFGDQHPSLNRAVEAGKAQWAKERPEQAIVLEQAQYAAKENPHAQYESGAGEQSANRAAERFGYGTEQRRENPQFEVSSGDTSKLAQPFQMLQWDYDKFGKPDPRDALANITVRR